MSEKNKIKICHVVVLDGTTEDIQQVSEMLNRVKEKTNNENYEFIVSNQTVEFKNIDFLIESLKDLKSREE